MEGKLAGAWWYVAGLWPGMGAGVKREQVWGGFWSVGYGGREGYAQGLGDGCPLFIKNGWRVCFHPKL